MRKKNIIVLEWDDAPQAADSAAYLLLQTAAPGYILADNLNRLYHLALGRTHDIIHPDDTSSPLYRYHDTLARLKYFLVEPINQNPDDKILLILGESAPDTAADIFNDLTHSTPVADGDLLAAEHAALKEELLSDFTIVTLLDFDNLPAKGAAGRRSADLQRRCEDIMEYIERQRLDLDEQGNEAADKNNLVE